MRIILLSINILRAQVLGKLRFQFAPQRYYKKSKYARNAKNTNKKIAYFGIK